MACFKYLTQQGEIEALRFEGIFFREMVLIDLGKQVNAIKSCVCNILEWVDFHQKFELKSLQEHSPEVQYLIRLVPTLMHTCGSDVDANLRRKSSNQKLHI